MSEGFCDVDFSDYSDDADPVQLYDEKTVKARKAHVCTECGGTIASGDTYTRKSYHFDGKFQNDYVCDPCREAASEFEHRIIGGMFWQSMGDQWDEGANVQGCINRLVTARAKEHMRQQWLKWQADRDNRRRERARRLDAVRRSAENPS